MPVRVPTHSTSSYDAFAIDMRRRRMTQMHLLVTFHTKNTAWTRFLGVSLYHALMPCPNSLPVPPHDVSLLQARNTLMN